MNHSFEVKSAEFAKVILQLFKKESFNFAKPICVGFCLVDLSRFVTYEWCYDKTQPYYAEDNLE